jgi:hypothetical protein
MDEGYQQWKKFDLASAVVRNMDETVPADRGIKSGSPHRRQCNQAGPFQEPSGSVYQGGLSV